MTHPDSSADTDPAASASANRAMGFWGCWSLTVGIMIGSGIFLLPAVLAPHGLLSFAGWAVTIAGSIALALVIARLAARTTRSGGVYAYTHDAFGDLTGFLVAWGYWAAYWIALPAMAIAFVGYLAVLWPAVSAQPVYEAGIALALIWTVALINLRGIREAGLVQLVMTVLKLLPLMAIIALAVFAGSIENLPPALPASPDLAAGAAAISPAQPTSGFAGLIGAVAASALLTMWAFSGLEAGTTPASDIHDPARTVPRAIISGTLTVAAVYVAATLAVMLLVPAGELAESAAPFARAAEAAGAWGPALAVFVALGAMISTAGALNGTMLVLGQIPMAVALDGLAPRIFAQRSTSGSPRAAILLASVLASLLLLANYAQGLGLLAIFEFLALMSTLSILVPLLLSAVAELRHSLKQSHAKAMAIIAGVAIAYSLFAILGSGWNVILWGLVLMAAGVPLYYWLRR